MQNGDAVKLLVDDSWALHEKRRYHSALTLALIAVEAAAFKRYGTKRRPGYIKSPTARFKRFLKEESRTHNLTLIKHGVDLPAQPQVGPPPDLGLQDSDELDTQQRMAEIERWREAYERWSADHSKAFEDFRARIKDVGDNFAGKYIKVKGRKGREWESYLGIPRLVTTTGVLYQVRCELVHEGNMKAIRIIHSDDENSLSVNGVDPIEFSCTWIPTVLGLVASAKENQGLFR
jgi:hypothetical protein